MLTRRNFIQQSTLAGMMFALPDSFSFLRDEANMFAYRSDYLDLKLLKDYPAFGSFSTDSLGKKQFRASPLLETARQTEKEYNTGTAKNRITWFLHDAPVWECQMRPRSITFHTRWKSGAYSDPFTISFSQKINHCTVLGTLSDEKQMHFPCLLHFPGMGTFRITCSDPGVTLFYDADRDVPTPFVKIALPAANDRHQDIAYHFESVAVYPDTDHIKDEAKYDGFRRNFINIFQINPRKQVLANNSASDPCAFTLYMYAEMARHTPELAKGLTAMDMVSSTLDKYIGGQKGYGQVGYPGWQSEYDSSDSMPSLVIAACNYILSQNDGAWANKNYNAVKGWMRKMMASDVDQDGLIEYGYSGNSGSWDTKPFKRPANWWDTIGFGYKDAYSNALAYKACRLMAEVAEKLQKQEDSLSFNSFADKLKTNYYPAFYNPDTGVLAGWRSADGRLHDYFFTFVSGVSVSYDLVEGDEAKKIMTVLWNKMKEVGYTDFRLGLPGNLVPVADEDYVDHNPRFGYRHFQVYENGGATGCYVYYTLRALHKAGMMKEAEEIRDAMLESYKKGSFQGYCPGSNMTKDWKSWKGECWGYEGFLVDNYLALLGVAEQLKEG